MIVAIIQCVFNIIYRKSNRVHLSLFAYCYAESFFCPLFYKGKQIDTALLYSKSKGYFYVIGIKGMYKFGRCKFKELLEGDLTADEKSLINQMKEECKNKIVKFEEILQSAFLKYEETAV